MFQPRPHQPRFTEGEMREILEARTRLEAIRNKCQPYPEEQAFQVCEAASTPSSAPAPEPHWSRRQWDRVEQLQGQMLHLESKVTGLLARRKPRGKY